MFQPPSQRWAMRRNWPSGPARLVRHASVLLVPACLMLCGCVQEMANQPRVDVMEPTAAPLNDPSLRVPPAGTIARGQSWQQTAESTGRENGQLVDRIPLEVNDALMQRGRQRFNIYCQHCHGPTGSGDGMVVQRGFPAPPTYHSDRLRDVPDGHIFVTISQGFGRMPALGKRIRVEDRWAIVAYVRALQLSQNAIVSSLPENQE